MANYESSAFHDESDADDEYERSVIASPTLPPDTHTHSPTDSDPPSTEHTPTTFSHKISSVNSPRGLITGWSPEQCADYVTALAPGLEKYGNAIIDEAIDGEALVAIQHTDLKDIGVASVGHRLTILKAVYEVKLEQHIQIEPDHYVPLSADSNAPDFHATQDDVKRIIDQIKLRDERIMTAEAELRQLREDMQRIQEEQRKLREDTLPIILTLKNKDHPLPTPDGLEPSTSVFSSPNPNSAEPRSAIARKFPKNTVLAGGNIAKLPSPTIYEGASIYPSAAAMAASDHLTASMSSGSAGSPHMSQQPSPTSPAYNTQPPRGFQSQPSNRSTYDMDSYKRGSTVSTIIPERNTPSTTVRRPVGAPQTSNRAAPPSIAPPSSADDPGGFMKSFRVSMEEPCHKVLPVALKKYNIIDDWREYSLYIVHGDEERCLGLEEKPLILFKQLANEGKKPMFMLRKHAPPPQDGFEQRRGGGMSMATGSRIQSYASSMNLPGGVL